MNTQETTSSMIGKTVTIVGISYYYGNDVFRVGEIFPCHKESADRNGTGPIRVTTKGLGTLGYLAGRKETAAEGTMLSSEIYRTVEDSFPIRIREVSDKYVIAEIVSSSMQGAFADAVPSSRELVLRLSPKHLDAYYKDLEYAGRAIGPVGAPTKRDRDYFRRYYGC